MGNNTVSNCGWFLSVDADQIHFGADTAGVETTTYTANVNTNWPGSATNGDYSMVTITREATSNPIIYINGAPQATLGSFTSPASSSNPLIFGVGTNVNGLINYDGNMWQPQILEASPFHRNKWPIFTTTSKAVFLGLKELRSSIPISRTRPVRKFPSFSLLYLLAATPLIAPAQYTFVTNSGGTLTVTGYSDKTVMYLSIPETTNGLEITEIGPNAFSFLTNLTAIVMPETLTSVGIQLSARVHGFHLSRYRLTLQRLEIQHFLNVLALVV